MQADHCKSTRCRAAGITAGHLPAVAATWALWPLLLPAAEPAKPDVPLEQQQPLEQRQGRELKRIKAVYASFPELALRLGMSECTVDLRFTVLPDGSTADVEVIRSEPVPLFALFELNAIRAVQQWRYEPYEPVIRDGQPVAETAEVRIRFEGPGPASR